MGKIKKPKKRGGRQNLEEQINSEKRVTDKFRIKFRDEIEEKDEDVSIQFIYTVYVLHQGFWR